MGRRRGWVAVGALAFTAGCASSSLTLTVQVRTDLTPSIEFATLRVDVEQIDVEEGAEVFSSRQSFVADPTDPFVDGVEVAQADLPQSGRYRLSVVLLDRDGLTVARRTLEVEVRDAFLATVLIDRGCLGVVCPGDGDPEDATECLAGRCVGAECAADPGTCGAPDCADDNDCGNPVSCAQGRCVEARCLIAPIPPGGANACRVGEICSPEEGCVLAPDAACAGSDERLCGLQQGICAGATVRCQEGLFVPCGSRHYGPRYEIEETRCDGFDNDCDGEVDEAEAPQCPLQDGVCAGSRRLCAGSLGQLACDYASFDFRYEPVEQTCDGEDNDCDGAVDELGRASLCPAQDGVCGGSQARCEAGRLICDAAQYGATYETNETRCDGLDNDCDRFVDEALDLPACPLQQGVCAGTRQRCGGASGFLACGRADYGDGYEPSETRCDGLDNDCDGSVDEGITRACDRGCGGGTEVCVAGVFTGCDAPTRTRLADVSLAGGTYGWECLDIASGTTVTFGPATSIQAVRDVVVEESAILVMEGTGGHITAGDVTVRATGVIRAGHVTIEAANTITLLPESMIDAAARGSGGGGGACSALTGFGRSAGGGGGSDGGAGGRGGSCRELAGRLGGAGLGTGTTGAMGCACDCDAPTPGASSSGGDGAGAPAGAGGGGGAGGAGGSGRAGAFPLRATTAVGGAGGEPSHRGLAPPMVGGGGGGGGGAERDGLNRAGCGPNGGNGGGLVVLEATTVANHGRVAVEGGVGAISRDWQRHGASGGGGGGAVIVRADTFDNVGVVTATGGAGGAHVEHSSTNGCADTQGGGAGGGGGGLVWIDVTNVSPASLSRTSVGGGAGGAGDCAGEPGAPGSVGRVCCVSLTAGCDPC